MCNKVKNSGSRRRTNYFIKRHTMKGNETVARHFKRKKPRQFQGPCFKPKSNFVKKRVPLKGSQPKGDTNGKPKGLCFNFNEVGHYSKDCPKPKLGNRGYKVIAPTTNLTQGECNHLLFFIIKGRFLSRCYVFWTHGLPTTL